MMSCVVATPIPTDEVPDRILSLCQEVLKKNNEENLETSQLRHKASNELLSILVHARTATLNPLVFKAVGRLLSKSHSNDANTGANMVLALCNRLHFFDDGDDVEEYEKLCAAAPSLLTQLLFNIEDFIRPSSKTYYFGLNLAGNDAKIDFSDDELSDVDDNTIINHLQAATVLIATCKHKVRSGGTTTDTIEKVQQLSWSIMGSKQCRPDLMAVATKFSAIVPILGQQTSQPPATIWSQLVFSSFAALCISLHAAWPTKSFSVDWAVKDGIGDRDQWLIRFKPTVIEQEKRRISILHRIQALTKLIIALLEINGYERQNSESMLKLSEFPLLCSLQVCELMIKFGSGAEGKCLLRSSIKNELSGAGALLSPKSVVSILPSIRVYGLELLSAIISTVTVSYLPHCRRLNSMIEYSLEMSCSTAVQSHAQLLHISASSAEQWLNKSVQVRFAAVNVLKTAVISLGCCIVPYLEKSLLMVTACLLEQTLLKEEVYENGGDWVSMGERINLIESTCQTLAVSLNTGGSFLSMKCRSSIETVLSSCLGSITQCNPILIMRTSRSKLSLLNLSRASICAPWQDGSSSLLGSRIRATALKLRADRDPDVVSSALETICLCDALVMPRAPPFVVATREVEKTFSTDDTSLIRKIEQQRSNIVSVKKQKQLYIDTESSSSNSGNKEYLRACHEVDATNDLKDTNISMDIDKDNEIANTIQPVMIENSNSELNEGSSTNQKEESGEGAPTHSKASGGYDQTNKNEKTSHLESVDTIRSETKIGQSKFQLEGLKNLDDLGTKQDAHDDSDSCPDICIDED